MKSFYWMTLQKSTDLTVLLKNCAFQIDFPSDHGGGCPHSYPFITGDTFRAFADVAFDNTERLYRPGYHKYFLRHAAC